MKTFIRFCGNRENVEQGEENLHSIPLKSLYSCTAYKSVMFEM